MDAHNYRGNTMKNIYIGKDQNWQEESTTYWFRLNGKDYGTKVELSNVYGIVESGPCSEMNGSVYQVVDNEGTPLTDGDTETIAVINHAQVTDAMRSE